MSCCPVQAVHDEVPPDALSPLLRQLVDQFVHDRARPEVMSLGLKTVRSLCERAPLVMTPELLQVCLVIGSCSFTVRALPPHPDVPKNLLWPMSVGLLKGTMVTIIMRLLAPAAILL